MKISIDSLYESLYQLELHAVILSENQMLLERDTIRQRWIELLAIASQIDVAVAWITGEGLTDQLVQVASVTDRRVRVISGYHDFLTSPEALRRLHAKHLVKVFGGDSEPKYHPKLYLFRTERETICWVGSANLTDSGFGGNIELVHDFLDDGTASTWFEKEWQRLEYATPDWLDQYEERWNERQRINRSMDPVEPLDPPQPVQESLIIRLRPAASRRILESLLIEADHDPRLKNAPDFREMSDELNESRYRAISLRSFLWLAGWCNTGDPYEKTSEAYVKPLVEQMFGYLPPQFLDVGGTLLNLKRYRYRSAVPPEIVSVILDLHRSHLEGDAVTPDVFQRTDEDADVA